MSEPERPPIEPTGVEFMSPAVRRAVEKLAEHTDRGGSRACAWAIRSNDGQEAWAFLILNQPDVVARIRQIIDERGPAEADVDFSRSRGSS